MTSNTGVSLQNLRHHKLLSLSISFPQSQQLDSESANLMLHSSGMWCAVRDTRREGQLVGGTNKKRMVTHQVDVSEKTEVRIWTLSNSSFRPE